MSDTAKLLRDLSRPWESGEQVQRVIERTAKLASLTYWRAFDIWYGKARRVEPYEIEAIEAALLKKNRREIRNEVADIQNRIALIEARLSHGDAEFLEPHVAALRATTDRSR